MSSVKWMGLAATLALSVIATGCTEPRGELAGCTSDEQCKGVRVCSPEGECVSPLALGDAGADANADVGTSDTSPDTTGQDTDPDPPDDTGTEPDAVDPPDDCNPDLTASATIASGQHSSGNSITIAPGAEVEVDASSSTGEIDRYEWSFVDFPHAADLPHLEPQLGLSGGGRAARFDALAIGTYVIELSVYDSSSMPGCEAARLEAEVATDDDIFVELVWNTPGDDDQADDDGADLDLHYMHPDGEWGYEPYDIFWYNPTADWGIERNPRDDPELVFDDEDGSGPESISHPQAEALKYRVGVYYYDDYGFGPSEATVRIYLDGTLAHEVKAEELPELDTFYEAVTIDAANGTVTADDQHYDGYPPTN